MCEDEGIRSGDGKAEDAFWHWWEEHLAVMRSGGNGYRNCRMMAISMLCEQLCREEDVGFVDL